MTDIGSVRISAVHPCDRKRALVAGFRRKGQIRKALFLCLLCGYVVCVSLAFVLRPEVTGGLRPGSADEETADWSDRDEHERVKRALFGLRDLDADPDRNCTPRAVDEFPANFFTLRETQQGAIALHILIAIYMFGFLAIVCDDYFVSSLESICERLELQEDVAGATFMAAGSSAPEFFTSVIGVFIAKSDVGVGTIVGSAVFNILFIIGVCAIFAGMIVHLTWYPMTRDCVFYLISIAALVITIQDEKVYWYEGLILVLLYALYIVIMYFNRTLEARANACMGPLFARCRRSSDLEKEERQPLAASEGSHSGMYGEQAETPPEKETGFSCDSSTERSQKHEEKQYESPFIVPEGAFQRLYWAVMMPVKCLLFVSVPDCRREGVWKRLYMLTFTMSIVWIAASSYLMVWMVTIIGDALDIPDTVMGLTILAAGTSVPDCLSSVFVARDGFGDMAVSNSIGSNVFDILMCLGLPWLLATTIVKKGDPLVISSGGLAYSTLILLFTVAFMLIGINLARWRLTKPFGVVCLVAYVLVTALSCLFELNVFGDLNQDSCPRSD
ncbi:sodium/potassium/calcium exchanger 4-like [Dreissena polymorpha]|uniref:Sodium/calcium exchanger membrane region domain-containing protein n=1 Tax=Dreissena polymorpha TaxID=45954 RepID=A0A9D4NI37_DREPO|nr:sodium/potassium/calcium exchanger 4-like [Dreissena polymorpha]KAH3894701.1 hypothetical protein DPMN_018858 [Dreissena polymorpha]